MPRPHFNLRCKMAEKDYISKDLVLVLDRKTNYISARMNGHLSWMMDEVYTLCDELGIPYDEIPKYFPRRGVEPTNEVAGVGRAGRKPSGK